MSSESALKRLLKRPAGESVKIPQAPTTKTTIKKAIVKTSKKPGRPAKVEADKARNFTLCLAPEFLRFLDQMAVKDPKVQGRGRKIRFIIERFIEHEKRSLSHMRVLRETLAGVQDDIKGLEGRVRKGEKLNLTIKERTTLSKSIDQVMTLIKILNYPPKNLQKMLPREDWAVLSFCLDWHSNNKRIIL